jgi:(1->4)-alpha-D-glucan 1-alpha-D-glucosylmutase
LEEFVAHILTAGRVNSLTQCLLKFTAPGVPDTYQGSELWDLSLVDPDNRRPVDYDQRARLLTELQQGMSAEQIMTRMDCGLPKLWLTHRALSLRREHPEWFNAEAGYVPIVAEGSRSEHFIGYLRGERVAALAPRWPLKLSSNWSSAAVELPAGLWKNLLTRETIAGGRIRVQTLMLQFPVALLVREST